MTYETSLLISLAGFSVMAVAYYGWGSLLGKLLLLDLSGSERVFSLLWLGWCWSLLFFQACNFFVPISAAVSAVFFLVGVALWMAGVWKEHSFPRAISIRASVYIVVFGLFAAWTASWAMTMPMYYDSGLYHFNAIRWLNEYPIVTGIGNLHARFAFNQSFFAYAAALNVYPFLNHGHNLANSFLIVLLIAECLSVIVFARTSGFKDGKSAAVELFLSFCILPVAIMLTVTNSISSPATDIAATVLQMALLLYFARYLEQNDDQRTDFSRFTVLMIISATIVTLKLSMIIYAFAIAVIAALLLVKKRHPGEWAKQTVVTLTLFLVLIAGVWIIRSYLQSGYPLFPSTFAGINFDWTVPRERAILEKNSIYSWARWPGVSPDIVLNSWDWIRPWLETLFYPLETSAYPLIIQYAGAMVYFPVINYSRTVVYPLGISLVVLAVLIVLLSNRRFQFSTVVGRPILMLSAPIFAGLIFWFFTAPDPRFAGALPLLLPAALLYPILKYIFARYGKGRAFLISIVFTMIAYGSISIWLVENAQKIASFPTQGYGPVFRAALKVRETASGLKLLMPAEGDQCWDSELPCTPYFNKDLHLRGNGIRSGFSVR